MVSKKGASHKKISKHKKIRTETSKPSRRDVHIERVLIENFVSFQKVMTNLSIKFDSLATQISNLLELFETSAKSLAEKNIESIKAQEETKEILKKVDDVLTQNKVIARGLTLMHEKIPEAEELENEDYEPELTLPPRPFDNPPTPEKRENFKPKKPTSPPENADFKGYQKSIADI